MHAMDSANFSPPAPNKLKFSATASPDGTGPNPAYSISPQAMTPSPEGEEETRESPEPELDLESGTQDDEGLAGRLFLTTASAEAQAPGTTAKWHRELHPPEEKMHTYIHAYMHACIHAYMHACVHTYIRTYIHGSRHECSNQQPTKTG